MALEIIVQARLNGYKGQKCFIGLECLSLEAVFLEPVVQIGVLGTKAHFFTLRASLKSLKPAFSPKL